MMTRLGKKPLLITGIVLCSLWGLGQYLQTELAHVGQWGLWGLTLGGFVVWRLKRSPKSVISPPVLPLERSEVETAIAETHDWLTELGEREPQLHQEGHLSELQARLKALPQMLEHPRLIIGITGGKRTGKTALITLLQQQDWGDQEITWQETLPLFTEQEQTPALTALMGYDCLLFLTTGDLTDRQWQTLQTWQAHHHTCYLLFNKQDQYRPAERAEILAHLTYQVQSYIPTEQVLAIAVAPQAIAVRHHQADGSITESWEQPPADLGPLLTQLQQDICTQGEQWRLGTLWRQVQQIKQEATTHWQNIRRDRALPVIEQYQWLAAGTALVNPVASLDLVATAAINGQMVLDVSQIYQQKLTLQQAQTVAMLLGELMVKLGLVELSSQALAGLLKTQPLTYVAGGVLQGLSAAYLTRLAGLGLIEYLQEQELSSSQEWNRDRLSQKLTQVFEQTQKMNLLPQLLRQGLEKLQPNQQPQTAHL